MAAMRCRRCNYCYNMRAVLYCGKGYSSDTACSNVPVKQDCASANLQKNMQTTNPTSVY